jgi:site-specific DNA recombinase
MNKQVKKSEKKAIPPRATGYIRVSTEEQAKEGISLEAQAERIKALAIAKGWQLTGIIEDRGYSGKNLERPGVKRLIDICKKDKVDIVIVYKVDRLTRRQKNLWHLLEDVFEPCDVGFISVSEPFDTTTATGKAFLGMLGVFAQLERELISERTREGLRHKRINGEWVGRQPVGFKINGEGRLEEDPETLRRIQRAKRMKREGRSVRDIAGVLDMSKSTVHRLINVNLRSLKFQYING